MVLMMVLMMVQTLAKSMDPKNEYGLGLLLVIRSATRIIH